LYAAVHRLHSFLAPVGTNGKGVSDESIGSSITIDAGPPGCLRCDRFKKRRPTPQREPLFSLIDSESSGAAPWVWIPTDARDGPAAEHAAPAGHAVPAGSDTPDARAETDATAEPYATAPARTLEPEPDAIAAQDATGTPDAMPEPGGTAAVRTSEP
jgi:hypothetical protein